MTPSTTPDRSLRSGAVAGLRLPRGARLLLALLLITACGDTRPPPQRPPGMYEITYQYLPPIPLAVAEINIVEEYRPDPGSVELAAPLKPAAQAARWARDRLVAAGREGTARFTILEASIAEVALPTTGGVLGALTQEQAHRFDARVAVLLEVENDNGLHTGTASAVAERSRTVEEGITRAELDQALLELTDNLLMDLNGELEASIFENLSEFIPDPNNRL